MTAFVESERRHVYGCYSGCPCKAKVPFHEHGRARVIYPEDAPAMKAQCPDYVQKDRRKHSNWDANVKLPYGEWEYLECAFRITSAPDGCDICKKSLRADRMDDAGFQDEYMRNL